MVTQLDPPGCGSSDYGSDFSPEDENAIIELLSQVSANADPISLQADEIENDGSPKGARMPQTLGRERWNNSLYSKMPFSPVERRIATPIRLGGDSSQQIVESESSHAARQLFVPVDLPRATRKPETPDLRSPLERFRSPPKKTLSVTDLVSPSWCELQYWYVLTKHGRKRRTPAMRQGSAVHKTLEDQVHQTVAIDVKTKEDAWGLRIWNVIQGLKTLRDTGMTRELEVWGVLNGLVVNGVIDELSYICPDRELEEEATARTAHRNAGKSAPAADQAMISSFFESPNAMNGVLKSLRSMRKSTDKIYLTDVKTRGVKTIPIGASFRPTLMQLMLYHLLLSNLATGKTSADVLFARYNLNSNIVFSDTFIAQLGSLYETFYDAPSTATPSPSPLPSSQNSLATVLSHNTLSSLWALMMVEFSLTFPAGMESIGSVLKAEYRDWATGDITGLKTFLYDSGVIGEYVDDGLRWWRGEREARGVDVEEAYKCRSCEFAEGCEWRRAKIEDARDMMRAARTKSVV